MQILILALQSDLHVDSIVYYLNKKGVDVFRVDPTLDEDIPIKTKITSDSEYNIFFEFNNNKIFYPLDCKGVLCRFAIDSLVPTSEDPLKNFSSSESLCAFLSPLRMIESKYWINDPWIENRVDCKIYQSKIAQTIGLNIPDFIVSSDYDDLLTFNNKHKNVIIKPLSDASLSLVNNNYVKQEDLFTNDFNAPYTAKFKPIDKCQNIDNTPTLLQKEINKKSDIRATIIDNNIFAVEMPYKEGSPIDFRLNKIENMREYKLPNDIENKLIKLLKYLGIRFVSCDLILDNNNIIYFIEANVQGNWLWTEINENINISENIAKALIYGNI